MHEGVDISLKSDERNYKMGIRKHAVLKRFRKEFFLFFLYMILIGFSNSSMAQVFEQIQIPSSPNPVGSGARALGMGGAFIAIADDATAASWNPGGLNQLERPEISIVEAYFQRTKDTTFTETPEASGDHDVSETKLNYFSLSYPFRFLNKNMTISINYQNLYDFTNKWYFPMHQRAEDLMVIQFVNADQTGNLSALGTSYCLEIIKNISLGVTFNLWEDSPFNKNQWEQSIRRNITGSFSGKEITGESYSKDTYDFSGFNFNLGILWHINGKWTFGAVLKTPFTADLSHERNFSQSLQFSQNSEADFEIKDSFIGDEKLTMPMSYGIGIAYRMSDKFTISADIYRTEWSDFIHEDANGNETSPITGTPENQADIGATHQVRIGAEYLIIKPKYAIPLRGGVFYDPAPAKGSSDDYFGLSIGSGIAYGRYIFDIAFQYRFGNNVGESISENIDFTQDVEEYTIYSSLIIHF